MSTDIGRISTGQPAVGISPPKPSPAPSLPSALPPPTVPDRPAIAPPEAASGGGGLRKIIFIGGGLLVLFLLGYLVMALLGGSATPTETPTPSPTASATLAPTVKTLRTYFGASGETATLSDSTPRSDFRNALLVAQPAQKQAVAMTVKKADIAVTAPEFFQTMVDGVPTDLTTALATDWTALAFGQSEAFDELGQKVPTSLPTPRLVLVVELTDASKANQALSAWESAGLASSSQELFGYDSTKAITPTFSIGIYRQVPVRYWNFPYADQSLDYAIVLASNGKNYLVMAGSREAAFFAIDQLMQ